MLTKGIIRLTLFCLLLSPSLLFATNVPQNTDQIARISVEEFQKLMEREPVVIVDARVTRAWKRAGNKIPGAIRLDTAEQITRFAETTTRQQAIVLYCL